MYEVFYNFKAEPFRLSPDHKFCYEHKSYAKARAYMAYAFKRAEGFVMITGRPGTGKTTLIGELVESLSKDRVCTANLVCTQLQADDLLKSVAFSFGIGSAGIDKAEMLQRLTVLLHRWHREGRRALLVVDEAQDLSSSAMEELRLLTNIQIGGQPLLQIFLLGQPELRDLVLSPEMEQVHQRIVAASHIEGLGVEETEAYVLHRLTVVGWRGDPAIERAVFPLIHKFSEGVPRRINLICSRLFLLGSVEQRHNIRLEDVRVVITELQAENLAAGTGISPEDFDQVNEPEWVPAPQTESQVTTANRLHAVLNEQAVSVDATPSDSLGGAKKKDFTDLTLHSHPIPEAHSSGPDISGLYFEDRAEYDQDLEPSLFNESITTGAEPPPHPVEVRNSVPEPAGVVKSPGLSRRFIASASVVIAVLALIFLAVNFFNRDAGAYSERGYVAGASVERSSSPLPGGRVPDTRIANELSEQNSKLSLQPSAVEADYPPTPGPSKTEVELTQEAFVDNGTSGLSESLGTTDQNELASTSVSAAEDIEEPIAEPPASVPDSGSTISVNFTFDSDHLIPDAHLALDQAVVMLRENPDSIAAITGFTDNQGDEYYNLMLSRKRADAVKRYLVEAGIEQERLHVEGRGVLMELAGEHRPEVEDSMEPYRVVRIELSSEHSQ